MPQKHMWDQVTDSLISWITNESPWYVNAIKGGGDSPFAQPLSEDEKKQYYESQMYNPDGSENDHGRQEVLQRIGIQQYIPLLSELEKKRSGKLQVEPPISTESTPDSGGNNGYS